MQQKETKQTKQRTRSAAGGAAAQPPGAEHRQHVDCRVKRGSLDLRSIDGRATRQIDASTGNLVERKFTVLWDQRRDITRDQLTKKHKLVKVTQDEFQVCKQHTVLRELTVPKEKVVAEKQRVEIPFAQLAPAEQRRILQRKATK